MKAYSEEIYLSWLDELAQKDFVVIDNYLSEEIFANVFNFFQSKRDEDALAKAGIGSLGDHTIVEEIRGDYVYWIDKHKDQELVDLHTQMDDLVAKVNRYLFLSISDFEYHLAFYPKGTFYQKHLDQFKGRNNRQLSYVLYLNKDWKQGDGGELRIFGEAGNLDIAPKANRLVLFKSGVLEHEVLTTETGRMSLTGWMLNNPVGLGFL
ncbi:2OG-Fe(II) oxygenase [Lishizhenia sp.]|uniref:2OG-Fe(II) oxygenase n=1 Tax=Lishizhenia sp. TaxID=2497594 RepID=UPI00299E3358|nr:2OG-Fe(II) oxygenase [Lishizhenia sp.]MDX1447025.1 2OG-Fe(II) oxygenase [Lishizhenia sp.]